MIRAESVRIALSGILHNRLRSALTMLGMLIGVGSVIMLVAVGTGSSAAVQKTIEGLGNPDDLHPLQRSFLRHDAFQCGYCTPGQLCSAVGMLSEPGPSAVTADLAADPPLTPGEIRERMSDNLCRCGAYVNIVAAIAAEVPKSETGAGA